MSRSTETTTDRVAHLLHRYLLPLIVLSYVAAATLPGPGNALKETNMIGFLAGSKGAWLKVTTPEVLLAALLFGAGLKVDLGRLARLLRRPVALLGGLVANVAVPLGFLSAMIPTLALWHNPDEAATVMVGLAMVSAMPIAGSSTGWSRTLDGDMTLSLGLVIGSTLISPGTTPMTLKVLGHLAPGRWGEMLDELSGQGTGSFLVAWVLLPSAAGVLARRLLGEAKAGAIERAWRIIAPASIVVLCYANASACLPKVVADPDWDFLAIILAYVVALSVLTFAAGYGLARALGVDRAERVSMTFALGMSNNGTGLVLASMVLGSRPMVLLPIIVYNLNQHLVAGLVGTLMGRAEGARSADPASSASKSVAPAPATA